MSTKIGSLQDFAKRDGMQTSREWVKRFSENKFRKGLLKKAWNGKVNQNFPSAIAQIDYARWIAACPFCGEFCMVDPDDKFLFCLYCAGNNTGDAGPVTFPEDNEREMMDDSLFERPVIVKGNHPSFADEMLHSLPAVLPRNWKPGQRVGDLRKQHNLAVGDVDRVIKEKESVISKVENA